jgi:hypothetical protein
MTIIPIDKCYDCKHCQSKWFTDTYDNPYGGRETTSHGHSYCDIDGELEISGLDIPKYCPIYGTKKKPKRKPNRIIRWYNIKTHGDISRNHNGLERIDFIQDEPCGMTYSVTIDELEKILINHFKNR